MLPNMKDVAKKSGVSIATVSHVINKTRFVSNEVIAKVNDAMCELDYHPNTIARSLRTKVTNTVSLIIPDISNYFFTSVAEGIESTLRASGYNLFLCNSNENFDNEIGLINLSKSQMIRGLIIAPTSAQFDYRSIVSKNFPMVFIDRKPIDNQGDSVLVENEKSVYEAIEILIKRGHKRIGFISGLPGLTTTDERIQGYKKALSNYSIDFDAQLIKSGDSKAESGFNMAKELINTTDITALLVSNNMMTIGAIKYTSQSNIKIPDQIAVIGYDDYEWVNITNPPLTVVKQPAYEIGQKSAEFLIEKIENPKSIYKEYRFPAEIVMRKSC